MDSVYHPGEIEIQRRAGARDMARRVAQIIARDEIPPEVARLLVRQRLAVASSVDGDGQVRASLLSGPAGFLAAVDAHVLRIDLDRQAEQLARDLGSNADVGLLTFDPTRRQRLRLNGRGWLDGKSAYVEIGQTYGNCTKYIQRRRLIGEEPMAADQPASSASALNPAQAASIGRADTLFLASWHPEAGADASHRGGDPGFVRVLAADRLALPNYPGNAMFNTLGNIAVQPRVGLLFVDFERGDSLEIAGSASIAADLTLEIQISEVRARPGVMALRFASMTP